MGLFKLHAPQNVSIITYGDAPWWNTELSSVSLPVREIAMSCGEFLLRRIRENWRTGEETTKPIYQAMHRPTLILRASTAPAFEAEIWAMPAEGFGNFVSEIPAPLSLGTVQFADGTCAKGFLAESAGLAGARDITEFGGWRAFRQAEVAERTAFYPEAIFKR